MPDSIDSVRWTDAQLIAVEVTYDDVTIKIRESMGRNVAVVASGHIGISLVGFWDETIIESASVIEDHPFAEACLKSIAERRELESDTGSPARNARRFVTLVLAFIDGTYLHCAASEVVVTAPIT